MRESSTMVIVATKMSALAARALRHRALLRRAQAAHTLSCNSAFLQAAAQPLQWRGSHAVNFAGYSTKATDSGKKLPSLVISEAFEEGNDDEDSEAVEGTEEDGELAFGFDMDEAPVQEDELSAEDESALSLDEKRELAKRLRIGMDRKKLWMQRLAEGGEFDTVLRVVYECYEPLYATHPTLMNTPCMLWESYSDPVAVSEAKTRYTPKWYDDVVTKITEQEAMSLFVNFHRPELALAVFQHREWLALRIGTTTVEAPGGEAGSVMEDVTVDFSKHFRSYYSWAMGAFASMGDHASVFTIYENALEDGVFPTANMTLTYLNSLIAKREFEAVEALFEQVQKDDRPMNMYFYRQMLFYVRAANKSTIMRQVLDEMKIKGYKIRSEDYLNAMRSLDSQYFRRPLTDEEIAKGSKPRRFVDESYRECIERITEQEASPEKYATLEAVCGQVIKMFEEMVEDEQIAPRNEQFFPRVIAAALFLQDLDRVNEYVALYEKCFEKPLTDLTAVKVATNALLVRNEPVAAWELVLKAVEATPASKPKGKRAKFSYDPSPIDAMRNVVEYLAASKQTPLLLQLLETLNERRALSVAMRDLRSTVLNALVQDKETINDTELWELVNHKYWRLFPVRTKTPMLVSMVNMCVAADRWAVAAKAIHTRDRSMIPKIPSRLAIFLSTEALKDMEDANRLELVAQLPKMVDIAALDQEQRMLFVSNAIRALYALKDDENTGRKQHWHREISRLYDQFLRGKPVSKEVREIMMQLL